MQCVPCPALPYFPTLTHKRHDFREEIIEHKMSVLIFSTNFGEKIFILRRNEREIIVYIYIYISVFMKSIRFSCQILTKLEFS
jgi:hypothetical protein